MLVGFVNGIATDPFDVLADKNKIEIGVHRPGNVGDVGYERAITLLALAQRRFGALPLADVARDALYPDHPAAFEDDPFADFQRNAAPLLGDDFPFGGGRQLTPTETIQTVLGEPRLFGDDCLGDVHVHRFHARVAESRFTGAVQRGYIAVQIQRVDDVVGVLEEIEVALFQGCFPPQPLADLRRLLAHSSPQHAHPPQGGEGQNGHPAEGRQRVPHRPPGRKAQRQDLRANLQLALLDHPEIGFTSQHECSRRAAEQDGGQRGRAE